MKPRDIAALLDEPGCEHNHKPKSGCARPKPGASAGGCAFDGAQIALLPVADVAHIVHGPIACAGSSWDNRGTRSSGPTLYRIGMTTDLTEQDVIMGRGEKRLFHAVKQAVESHRPAAVFVYNTCVPALIGDDVAAVCRAAEMHFGVPVVPVDAAGFYGTKNLGNRIAGDTMLRHVIGTREPDPVPDSLHRPGVTVHDVNLIGEYNIAGELWHVLPLLDELGLRVLCSLSGDSRYREIQTMHRAELNMLVCSKAMVNVARGLKERYGTPWFEGSFYGASDTSAALRDFARLLGDADLAARTEALIAREEARLDARLAPWRERLAGKRVLLYTGGVKSWSVVSALQDLGMEVVATGTKKSTEEDKARIRALMGEDAEMIEDGNARALLDGVKSHGAHLLIAGGRNLYTALKARLPFLDINQEREFGYAGYAGMVELARQLALSLESPVWEAVRRPSPWAAARPVQGEILGPRTSEMAAVIRRRKALSVSPLKSSQPVGGALAFMGLAKCIPMLHGSQGCTAFAKVFFVRHFREPVPLQTTAMDQISTVMGADENVVEGLRAIASKSKPAVIGLLSTGLSETEGADLRAAVKAFRAAHPEFDGVRVVPVETPDYTGCLESGYARAVEAIVDTLVPHASVAGTRPGRRPRQVNVLAGASLTPGDLEALAEIVEAFGLRPVFVPDLADSLDGHLVPEDFSPLTLGGTPLAEFDCLGDALATLVVGYSMYPAADRLRERTGVPCHRFQHLMGLAACDALVDALHRISGRPVPAKLERQRARLQDAMVDTHFMLGRARVAVAADPDLLGAFAGLLRGMGAETVAAVTSAHAPWLDQLPVADVQIGDLEDLERLARERGAELVIGSSHAAASAGRLGLPLLRAGFPLHDLIGGYQRTWIGYRGTRQALFDLANLLQSGEHHGIAPYRSPYSQKHDSQHGGAIPWDSRAGSES